uniref:AMP-binding domain-containing protein n=1 Tax=Ascaris lumbricoides TaxID=6252 RepID=A0A0M3IVR5_ASCLU
MPIKSQLADIEIPHIPFHDLIIDSLKKYATNVALVWKVEEMPIKSQLADIEIPHIPFHDLIIDSLKKYATNVVLINHDTNEKFTFADIISKTKYIANSLVSLGIEKGEAVILCVPNCPDFAWLFLGISMAGGIVCPLHPTFSIGKWILS